MRCRRSKDSLEMAEKDGGIGGPDRRGQFIRVVLSEKRCEQIRKIFL
jgi:hypothetical protein